MKNGDVDRVLMKCRQDLIVTATHTVQCLIVIPEVHIARAVRCPTDTHSTDTRGVFRFRFVEKQFFDTGIEIFIFRYDVLVFVNL